MSAFQTNGSSSGTKNVTGQEGSGPIQAPFTYYVIQPDEFDIAAKTIVSLQFPITIGGLIGNALCIVTFLRMGLKDSVTITFFNLAISDFLSLVFSLFTYFLSNIPFIKYAADIFYFPVFLGISSFDVGKIFSAANASVLRNNIFLIVFLGIQRSLCVMRPLHFNNMFTRRRTFAVLSIIWAYCLIYLVFPYVTMNFKPTLVPYANIIVLVDAGRFKNIIKAVNFYIIHIERPVIIPLCQATVLACLITLAIGLKRSVRFRQSMSNQNYTPTQKEDVSTQQALQKQTTNNKSKTSSCSKTNTGLGGSKERQAVVQVAMLCAIYVLCYMPIVARQLATIIMPALSRPNYYLFIWCIKQVNDLIYRINAGINFFVYFKFNTSFRRTLLKKKKKTNIKL